MLIFLVFCRLDGDANYLWNAFVLGRDKCLSSDGTNSKSTKGQFGNLVIFCSRNSSAGKTSGSRYHDGGVVLCVVVLDDESQCCVGEVDFVTKKG